MPAGLTRLFKSKLDWNLYSSLQEAANNRQASSQGPVQIAWLAKPSGTGGSSGRAWFSVNRPLWPPWVLLSSLV